MLRKSIQLPFGVIRDKKKGKVDQNKPPTKFQEGCFIWSTSLSPSSRKYCYKRCHKRHHHG